ncbi:tail fiber domain-containing protein [Patescibacteria group bacterium]|nr:tail fiber domain-containing protein [Patescibacteria group bacterium]
MKQIIVFVSVLMFVGFLSSPVVFAVEGSFTYQTQVFPSFKETFMLPFEVGKKQWAALHQFVENQLLDLGRTAGSWLSEKGAILKESVTDLLTPSPAVVPHDLPPPSEKVPASLQKELDTLESRGLQVEPKVIERTVVEKTIERIISGLSREELDLAIQALNNTFLNEIATLRSLVEQRAQSNFQAIALTNKIDSLSSVTLTSVTISGVTGLTDADIPDDITLNSGSSASFSGIITVSGTGTSTFAGGLTVDTNTLVVDFSSNRVGIGTTTSEARLDIDGGDIDLDLRISGDHPVIFFSNVSSPFVDSQNWQWGVLTETTFSGLLVNNANTLLTEWILVQRDSNNGMTLVDVVFPNGNIGIGTTTPAYKLTVSSSNATDNLFQISTTTDQGIFVVNNQGNVGIGTTSPSTALHVIGAGTFSADLTVSGGDIIGATGAALDLGEAAAGDITVTGDLIMADDAFIGISGKGRIEFDAAGSFGEVNVPAFLGVFTPIPTELLHLGKNIGGPDNAILLQNGTIGGSSTNETVSLKFSLENVGRVAGKIISGKESVYGSAANADSFLAFFTALDGTDIERVRILSNGNVGIGTTSPVFTLDAQGSIRASDAFLFSDGSTQAMAATPSGFSWRVGSASFKQTFSVTTEEASPQGVFFKPDGTKMYIVGFTDDEVNEYDLSTPWDISTASFNQLFDVSGEDTAPRDMFFKPDGTKMYITGSTGDKVYEYDLGLVILGNVGIGTTNPKTSLEVVFGGAADFGMVLRLNQNAVGNSDGPKIEFFKDMTTDKVWNLGILNGVNVDDFVIAEDGGHATGFGTARFKIMGGSGEVRFPTMPSAANDRTACIKSTTNAISKNSGACGTSSIRYKENIKELKYGLEEVLQLNPVSFNFKKEWDPEDRRRKIGLIAEETVLITPEVIGYNEEGLVDSLDYAKLVPVLTKAIQEMNLRIDLINAPTTTPAMYIDSNGNIAIGMGTTTPSYKLHVIGDIAATGFINTSSRDFKKDIKSLNSQFLISNFQSNPNDSISNEKTFLQKITETPIYEYRYEFESSDAPLRLGLIAEEAPKEVLSVDGKGVDIYKLATFTLLGVQELAAHVKSNEDRIAQLEESLINFQFPISNFQSNPNDPIIKTIVDGVIESFIDFGLTIIEGVVNFTKLVVAELLVGRLVVENMVANTLTVGSPKMRTGITLYDYATKEPYCVIVKEGQLLNIPGECGISHLEVELPSGTDAGLIPPEVPISTSTPDITATSSDAILDTSTTTPDISAQEMDTTTLAPEPTVDAPVDSVVEEPVVEEPTAPQPESEIASSTLSNSP